MAGLGEAASVIAVIQITTQVFDLCSTYFSKVKESRKDIKLLRDEVTSLQDILTEVGDLDPKPGSTHLPIWRKLNRADGPVQKCKATVIELHEKLEQGQNKSEMKRFGLRALKWPFNSKEVTRIIETIERQKLAFTLVLTADLA